MLFGSIDIGSNAMRFLVSSATEYNGEWSFQRVEYLRYPIRLGEDVFQSKTISAAKIEKFEKMLNAFKTMFEVFEVKAFAACATSAMRDAQNGKAIVDQINQKLGFEIEILNGNREAFLIEKAIHGYLDKGNYIHIDVGGGSTEINIISNYKKLASSSFNVGTVRALQGAVEESEWDKIKNFITSNKIPNMVGLGTGGNIKKLHELSEARPENSIQLVVLNSLYEVLKTMTIKERMHKLKLNEDRADVIIPAAEIFSRVLTWANVEKIYAPNVGLVDGIIVDLLEKHINNA